MRIVTNRFPDGRVEISVHGELDLDTACQLDTAVCQAVAEARTLSIVVDLSDVSFCDSSGIAALDQGYGTARADGVMLRIANPQPQVSRVLEIVGLLEPLTRQ